MLYHTKNYALKKATSGSLGYDLHYYNPESEYSTAYLGPGDIITLDTGITVGAGGYVYGRSGLATRYGIAPVNAVGVIDHDYRGTIKVALINHGKDLIGIEPGDRIAQFVPVTDTGAQRAETLEELGHTRRGEGGFGSTGR